MNGHHLAGGNIVGRGKIGLAIQFQCKAVLQTPASRGEDGSALASAGLGEGIRPVSG
jgi:hypothetical protein